MKFKPYALLISMFKVVALGSIPNTLSALGQLDLPEDIRSVLEGLAESQQNEAGTRDRLVAMGTLILKLLLDGFNPDRVYDFPNQHILVLLHSFKQSVAEGTAGDAVWHLLMGLAAENDHERQLAADYYAKAIALNRSSEADNAELRNYVLTGVRRLKGLQFIDKDLKIAPKLLEMISIQDRVSKLQFNLQMQKLRRKSLTES